MYGVFLVTEYNGNYHLRFTAKDKFDCEVWAKQHEYCPPADCHYEVCKMED